MVARLVFLVVAVVSWVSSAAYTRTHHNLPDSVQLSNLPREVEKIRKLIDDYDAANIRLSTRLAELNSAIGDVGMRQDGPVSVSVERSTMMGATQLTFASDRTGERFVVRMNDASTTEHPDYVYITNQQRWHHMALLPTKDRRHKNLYSAFNITPWETRIAFDEDGPYFDIGIAFDVNEKKFFLIIRDLGEPEPHEIGTDRIGEPGELIAKVEMIDPSYWSFVSHYDDELVPRAEYRRASSSLSVGFSYPAQSSGEMLHEMPDWNKRPEVFGQQEIFGENHIRIEGSAVVPEAELSGSVGTPLQLMMSGRRFPVRDVRYNHNMRRTSFSIEGPPRRHGQPDSQGNRRLGSGTSVSVWFQHSIPNEDSKVAVLVAAGVSTALTY